MTKFYKVVQLQNRQGEVIKLKITCSVVHACKSYKKLVDMQLSYRQRQNELFWNTVAI